MGAVLGLLLAAIAPQIQGPAWSREPSAAPPRGSVLWLRAGGERELEISNLVSRWKDRSGQGIDLEQADGAEKPYLASLAMNGRPALHFDGNDWLGSSTGAPLGSYTKVALLQLDPGTAGGHVLSTEHGHGLRLGAGGFAELTEDSVPFAVANIPVSPGRPAVLIATYDAGPGVGRLYLNGALVGTGWAVGDNADGRVRLGGLASGEPFSGLVAEILVYDRVLDIDERRHASRYLNRRHFFGAPHPEVDFETIPSDGQVIQRGAGGGGDVRIDGRVKAAGMQTIDIELLRDGQLFASSSKPLVYNDLCTGQPCAPFSEVLPIQAELLNYTLRAYVDDGTDRTLVAERINLVCGDVYLIEGQSNAMARDSHDEYLATADESPWVRSFGSGMVTSDVVFDLHWNQADALTRNRHGSVGAWATRMGSNLATQYQIPIALINGAVGTTLIAQHQRDDLDHENLNTIYGRFLYRVRQAGVMDSAPAIFWYQGETEIMTSAEYTAAFTELSNAWREDFGGLELIYLFQIREGCGYVDRGVRESQRKAASLFRDIRTMSTTAISEHDGCHYWYVGYTEIADRMTLPVARDFHGSLDTHEIDPPNLVSATFTTGAQDQILLTFEDLDDQLVWEAGSEAFFLLDNVQMQVLSGSTMGNTILLDLVAPTTAQSISYVGHPLPGPAIRNARGVGALTFFDEPIQ